MGQSDLSEKSLEFYPDVFADILNALLYQGERVVSAENLQAAPTETLYRSKHGVLRNQFHDISKYEMVNGCIKVQYTLENETTIKSKSILRKAGYEGAVYREQYDNDNVFPFISVMLYWGKRRWRAPRSIKQLLAQNESMEKSCKYIDDIQLHIFEMAHLPKEIRNRFQSDMRIVVDYLAEKKQYVPTEQKIVHLEAMVQMLSVLTHDSRYEEILPEMQAVKRERGEITMCELLDKYEHLGEDRMAQLNQKLIGLNRIADLLKASQDETYRSQLFKEFGIV